MSNKSDQDTKDHGYKAAFDEVIEEYMELKNSSDTSIKSLDYSKVEGSGANRANIVQTNKTEFICDVEKTVRKTLQDGDPYHEMLFKLFLSYYVHLVAIPDTKHKDVDDIRRIVGKAFVTRRVHPVSTYLAPKHIDRSKTAK